MLMEIYRLGVKVKDKATNLEGALMHFQIMDGANWYNFQPAALNPETGLPAQSSWISEGRVEGKEKFEFDFPTEVISTKVTDTITGFKGVVTAIILHINGCLHLEVQPEGTNAKTGGAMPASDFDIRTLKGKALKTYTERELDKSRIETPSPVGCPKLAPRAVSRAMR